MNRTIKTETDKYLDAHCTNQFMWAVYLENENGEEKQE